MSYFDRLESAANDVIIDNDFQNVRVISLKSGNGDGFNEEFEHDETAGRPAKMAISQSADAYIGTTRDTEIEMGDLIVYVNHRNERRTLTVTAFEPTRDHTLVTMQEARHG